MAGKGGPGGGMDFGAMMAMMGDGIWDMPMVRQIIFHVQKSKPQYMDASSGDTRDGTFTVEGNSKVAYRLFLPSGKARAVVFFFHGNAEVCTDIGSLKDTFTSNGTALLSIDYRGYAWGSGEPSISKICADSEECFKQAGAVLEAAGCGDSKRIAMGRSIGATCAVHLAATFAADVHGLVVDSGLMSIKQLPMVQQIAPQILPGPQGLQMLASLKEPVSTLQKLSAIGCPLLVMHGIKDEIVPISQGVECHEKCPTSQKTLRQWENATHNDVCLNYASEWTALITKLLEDAVAFHTEFPAGAVVEAHSLSAAELNGLTGSVLGPQTGGERFRVEFAAPTGEKALKPANLKVIERVPKDPFPPGATVEVHSLASAAGAAFNGKKGKVLGLQGDRVRIDFGDEGEKALKPANLKVVEESAGKGGGYGGK